VGFLAAPRRNVTLQFEGTQILQVGDPIFIQSGDLTEPIGYISRIKAIDSNQSELDYVDRAFAEIYSSARPLRDGDYLTYHTTPESIDWVVQMMLPPETRAEIARLIASAFRDHQMEIVTALQPIVEKSIRDAGAVIRQDLRNAFAKRDARIRELSKRFQTELVGERLMPLIRDEIWPIVQDEVRPLAIQIGEELWSQTSLWRFGWRAAFDAIPLTEKDLTKREFERFLKDKAVPILESHVYELVEVQQTIMTRISENSRVQSVITEGVKKIASDPDVQQLLTEVFKEVFVDNPRLREVLDRNWSGPEAQQALRITNQRLEPTITAIGETMFGNPFKEINPEFSRVLRNRVLRKDSRWLVLRNDGTSASGAAPTSLPVRPASTSTENPFHIPARPRS
jgi:hypothetical protein